MIRDHSHEAFKAVKAGENQNCNIVGHENYTKQVVSGMNYGANVKYDCGKGEQQCQFNVWDQPWTKTTKYYWKCDHLRTYGEH